ncbi:acetate--CoA ligase family protein [Pedococcus sp. P5_B7]
MTTVDQDVRTPLIRLLDPRSIAVIGASTNPSKRGFQVIKALMRDGFAGPILPVNPRGGTVLGLPVHERIADLPYGLDVALVAVSGRAVPDTIRQLGERGVAGAVVLANGFSETGGAGAALDLELRAAIVESGVRVVGPNTSGVITVASGANLVGVPDVPAGPVGLATQSGNMLLSFLADTRTHQMPGLHSYVGLGNQVDVGYAECVHNMATRPGLGAIAVHAEGFKDGRAFLVAATQAARQRPLVLLRGGRSAAGARTALSHTGAVAGSDRVARAVLAQAGIELVERSDELAIVAGVLATTTPVPDGLGVAVLSDGGGHAALAADALTQAGVPLAEIGPDTQARLIELLGPAAAVANPVDVAGATDADPDLFADAAGLLLQDTSVGLVLVIGMYGGYHLRFDERLRSQEDSTSRRLGELSRAHHKPVVVQSLYASHNPSSHEVLRTHGIPVLSSIDHAVRAVAALHRRGHFLATAETRSNLQLSHLSAPSFDGTTVLPEPSARALLGSAHIDTGPWAFAATPVEAKAAVARFDVPCAVKVVSPQVVHKSDAGGVRLNVTEGDVAFESIVEAVQTAQPGSDISGVVVAPMSGTGVELLIGAVADPVFGPVVAFGSGGVLVEAVGDVTFRAAPLTHREALEMIDETTAGKLLGGYRGMPAVDRDQLAALLVQIGDFAASTPRLAELDLNPVVANASGIHLVDVRVVLDKEVSS